MTPSLSTTLWESYWHLVCHRSELPRPGDFFRLQVLDHEVEAEGLPVVARDAPGLRDSVRDGETGFLVVGDDPARWAQALTPLLEQGEDALAMRRRALEGSKRFDWDRAADELLAAIEACLARKRR